MNKTYNYDIAILGGGLSGLFAAVRAAEKGVKSIGIFEAGNYLGGNGVFANTFVSSDFADYGNYDSDENAEKLYKRAMNTLEGTGCPELIYRYLYHTRDVAKWCEAHGLNEKWSPVTFGPFKSNCSLNVEYAEGKGLPRIGAALCKLLREDIEKHDFIETHLNARATKLLTNDEGTVCGALIQMDGGYSVVNCKKLILATGGVGGTVESLAKYLPDVVSVGDDIRPGGVATCVGDGVVMAKELGAETGKHMNIHLLGPGYAGGRGGKLGDCMDNPFAMFVTKAGKRFADESARFGQDLVKTLPGRVIYALYDNESLKAAWTAPKAPMGGPPIDMDGDMPPMPDMEEMPPMPAHEMKKDETPFEKLAEVTKADVAGKSFCIADSIEELAAFIGCDAAVLQASIDRYNADCEAGIDKHMRKDAKYLMPIKTAPFYALYSVRSLDSTQGGITVNKDLEALKEDGTAIKGMYVTGDHCTGFVSELYGPGGAGMTFAMVSGWLAGDMAADEV